MAGDVEMWIGSYCLMRLRGLLTCEYSSCLEKWFFTGLRRAPEGVSECLMARVKSQESRVKSQEFKSSSLDLLFLLPAPNFRHVFFTQIGNAEEDFTSRRERLDCIDVTPGNLRSWSRMSTP